MLDAPPGQPLVATERIAALLAHRAPGASALVAVDQLEELFTQASTEERERFLDALRALRAEPRCAVIFTLRADFSGALMESSLWPERPAQLARVEVSPLRGQALREAIAVPANDAGVTVEPELTERLVADAASEPGILPLLQEALVQLWDVRADQRLTLADYQALGDGVRSGLALCLRRGAGTARLSWRRASSLARPHAVASSWLGSRLAMRRRHGALHRPPKRGLLPTRLQRALSLGVQRNTSFDARFSEPPSKD